MIGPLAKFLQMVNIINLSIKLDTFPSKCKIPKIKPSFKKGIKTEAERPIYLMSLTSKMNEKQIHNQTKDYLCCTFINQVLEQIIPQIHICPS